MRIEEQAKQLKIIIDQQQNAMNSMKETRNTDSKDPNNLSPTFEDPELLVLDASDDDMIFPSKIS